MDSSGQSIRTAPARDRNRTAPRFVGSLQRGCRCLDDILEVGDLDVVLVDATLDICESPKPARPTTTAASAHPR
jgi:hypothetical protein